MKAIEIGKELVSMCRQGHFLEVIDQYYSPHIVSIEAMESPQVPQKLEGLKAVRGKNTQWVENHEVHDMKINGPFVGADENQFAVQFDFDVTDKSTGERNQMSEVALYSVTDGKIVREQFLYRMG